MATTMQGLTDQFQALQKDLSAVVEARQRLDSQLQENKSVQKVQPPREFSGLNEDTNIYKLIGPVLVKQDRAEAVMNVDKRLEFIEAEINRTEAQLRSIQEKQERKKGEIMQLQQLGSQVEGGPSQ
ncbi:Prefoldin subunit 6 [Maublancomyces gigas]|uniref:Prefoldin subunit 6 n=1 Tax=Discina gigas TaxID=1032678 RepID=A0ABR3GQE7_9PEZI